MNPPIPAGIFATAAATLSLAGHVLMENRNGLVVDRVDLHELTCAAYNLVRMANLCAAAA